MQRTTSIEDISQYDTKKSAKLMPSIERFQYTRICFKPVSTLTGIVFSIGQ